MRGGEGLTERVALGRCPAEAWARGWARSWGSAIHEDVNALQEPHSLASVRRRCVALTVRFRSELQDVSTTQCDD